MSCVATGIGIKQLPADFGIVVDLRMCSDASAGISLCKREGLSRAKNIAVQFLRVQAVFAQKAHTEDNRSDFGTKSLAQARSEHLLRLMWMEIRSATHAMSLENTVSVARRLRNVSLSE